MICEHATMTIFGVLTLNVLTSEYTIDLAAYMVLRMSESVIEWI